MNQTPAAVLVLAAAALSHAAHATSMSSHNNASVILTLCAIAIGLWGVVALIAACNREREMLIDSHARLDVLDRVMVREPLRALKEAARPVTRATTAATAERPRPLEISAESQSRLNLAARTEGRDRSEILDEILRQHLADYDQSRVA